MAVIGVKGEVVAGAIVCFESVRRSPRSILENMEGKMPEKRYGVFSSHGSMRF